MNELACMSTLAESLVKHLRKGYVSDVSPGFYIIVV